ncbi:MAG TPA: glycosyltransferase 87 family protein [Blastocatellia bacterium]|jgi:hypothetical protein
MIELNEPAPSSPARSRQDVFAFITPLVLAACALLSAWLYFWARDLHRFTQGIAAYISLFIGQFAIYLLACYMVFRRREAPSPKVKFITITIVIFFAIFFRAELVAQRPYLSTDIYRYLWDGRVQAAGINPYLYVPNAEELKSLRDDKVFPLINRGDYEPTPYPPAAQAIFLAVHKISPSSVAAFKSAMSLFDLITMLAVMLTLARMGIDMARVILFAWHPLLIFESAHTGHIESPFIAFLALALLAWAYRRPALAGAAIGLATMVKLYPMLVLPVFFFSAEGEEKKSSFLSRLRGVAFSKKNLLLVASFAATIVICYLPYLGIGLGVVSSLPGEVREEGFIESGERYFLLGLLRVIAPVPTSVFLLFAAIALAGFGLRLMIKAKRDAADAARGVAFLIGLYLLVTSPRYHWYYAWIIPFLCFAPRLEWIYLSGAAVLLYVLWYIPNVYPEMPLWLGAALYCPTLLLLGWSWRKEKTAKEPFALSSTPR